MRFIFRHPHHAAQVAQATNSLQDPDEPRVVACISRLVIKNAAAQLGAEVCAVGEAEPCLRAEAAIYGLRLPGRILRGIDLSASDCPDANFSGADLSAARLTDASLRRSRFDGAVLHGADLRGADLRCAELNRADLRGADLAGANLEGASLTSALLPGRLAGVHAPDIVLRVNRPYPARL